MRTTLTEVFLSLDLPKSTRILDVACGVGNVAQDLADAGYSDIDGMDPVKGYLEIAKERGLYRRTLAEAINADGQTSVGDGEYGAVVCCAGFFQGLISPAGLRELVRITETGGVIIWNIAAGYEHYGAEYEKFDEIVADLEKKQKWKHLRPVQVLDDVVFTDSGAAFLSGYLSAGIQTKGYIYVMQKI